MKFNNKPNPKYQTTCGKEVWNNRAVALVITIIALVEGEDRENPRVLTLKRGSGVNAEVGQWCLPCGYLDYDESAPEGAIREVWEEVGLDLTKITETEYYQIGDMPWRIVTEPLGDPRQNICLHYGIIFRCKELPKTSTDNCEKDEVDEIVWKQLSEVENMTMAFNHQKYPEEFFNKYLEENR